MHLRVFHQIDTFSELVGENEQICTKICWVRGSNCSNSLGTQLKSRDKLEISAGRAETKNDNRVSPEKD